MVEHEYDHVFVGIHEGEPAPDPLEVEGWHWIGLDELRAGLRRRARTLQLLAEDRFGERLLVQAGRDPVVRHTRHARHTKKEAK